MFETRETWGRGLWVDRSVRPTRGYRKITIPLMDPDRLILD